MFWWLMKYVILGPILRLMYRPKTKGLENLPKTGAAILAPNHQSFLDDFLLPLVIKRRRIVMLAKADYWEKWYSRWFFKAAGCIPVRREGGSASAEALRGGIDALAAGQIVGIFPEGTRSPDGRLYRGKTGVARMALEARVPVIPVAIVGTYEAWSYDRKLPKRGRVEIRFGKPLTFDRYFDTPSDRFVLRSVTDEIMYEIMMLSGQEYVDEYGSKVKKQLDRAKARAAAQTEPTEGEGATGQREAAEAQPKAAEVVDLTEPAEAAVSDPSAPRRPD